MDEIIEATESSSYYNDLPVLTHQWLSDVIFMLWRDRLYSVFGGAAMIDTKRLLALIACFGMFFWSTSSYAVMVNVDTFSASGTNSGGLFSFTDTFSDGTPPPCGPNGCVGTPTGMYSDFYGVNSTSPLSESGGYLQLNSAAGIISMNAAGGPRINETVQVGGAKSELLVSNPILTSATFNIASLPGPWNMGYGIRLVDAPPGSPAGSLNQALELNVQYWTGNAGHPAGLYVRYLSQDFVNGIITTIGANLLDPGGADQIMLTLMSVAGGLFEAQYAYGTNGSFGTPISLGDAGLLFQQTFLRPQIHAFDTVPLPGALPLFASGLGALGLLAWRRKRKNVAAGAAA